MWPLDQLDLGIQHFYKCYITLIPHLQEIDIFSVAEYEDLRHSPLINISQVPMLCLLLYTPAKTFFV